MTAPMKPYQPAPGQKPVPPIRENPQAPDDFDPERIQLVRRERWEPQTPALLGYHRTIEENVRMLAGRQWDVWSELLGSYVDVSHYLTDEERRWRQRPVVNMLQYWFMLTHARLTEHPQLPTFDPATTDRLDQLLADSLGPIFKTLWAETGMDETFVRSVAWLIAAGEVYVESAVDFTQGSVRTLQGPAMLSMQGNDGQQVERATSGPVPFDRQGNPQASLTQLPNGEFGYSLTDGAEAYSDYEGCIAPRVRSPLEVRAEWGSDIAWERKRWVITRSYLEPQEVFDTYQIDVEPDVDADGSAGFLQRLLFSSGYFGSVSNRLGSNFSNVAAGTQKRYVAVDACWERPSAFSPETDDSPGGRLLIVTGSRVLHDSARPYRTQGAGPIRRAQFIQQPGRAGLGSTPLEQMTPIQKTYNRGWAQILEHRNLSTNPILVVDANASIADEFSNLPGSKIEVDFAVSPKPAYYLEPPPLSADVWKIQQMLLEILMRLGSIAGAEGQTPTDDASGELVSQLRFNSDRPVSIAARSMARLIGGIAEDWTAILPTIWSEEKTLSYIGDDQVFRTVTITPDLWDGDVRVRPDLENAQLEAPEAKQARALGLFTAGVFGPPGTPEAAAKFADYARNAGLDAVSGEANTVDADMMRHLMSLLAQGAIDAQSIQYEEWYDYGTWTRVLREHLASPEFLRYPPETQQQFRLFYAFVQHAQQAVLLTQMERQAPIAAQVATTQGGLARIAQASGPQPPDSSESQSPSGGNPPDQQAA